MKKTICILCLPVALLLSGCDKVQQRAADLLQPPTAVEMNLRVLELARAGKTIEALKLGEDFLKSNPDPASVLHATLAKLYTEAGDTESAVRHLQQNAGSGGSTVIVTREASQPAAPSGPAASVDGASARITPNGIEVSAGGVSARVNN